MRFFGRGKKDDPPYHPRPKPDLGSVDSEKISRLFDRCSDFESRELFPGLDPRGRVTAVYIDGLVSSSDISTNIIRPLTEKLRLRDADCVSECIDFVIHGAVYSYSVKKRTTMDDTVNDIVSGSCAVIFDSAGIAVTFEVRSSQHRSVEQPTIEKSVKGAKDSFVETLRINTSLVRRRLHLPQLKVEQTVVGRKSHTTVAIVYVDGVADPAIKDKLAKRIDTIDVDGLITAGYLEYYICDRTVSPFPQMEHTERPDKFASELLNGRVGVLVDGLPLGFLLPVSLAEFMKVPEDGSQHFIISSALKLLRYAALLLALFLPALYVAVAMYHQEMIPTKLLISVINSKQEVPFSTAAEVLGMLVSFELLQEAGLRLPNPVGETISIIGALIVGQSAVDARVISPIAVIVVALAGIAGYTIPNQDLSAAVRLFRFTFVISAISLGMFGIMVGAVLLVWHLCWLESFGISYMSPIADREKGGLFMTFLRPPLSAVKTRDPVLKTPDRRKQK